MRHYLFFILLLLLPASLHAQSGECPLEPRLIVGNTGLVAPGQANNVRDEPGSDGEKLGQIPAGGEFAILDGPTCADGYNWWQVDYDGLIGWTVEGADGEYWLEPVEPPAAPLPYEDPDPDDVPVEVGIRVRVNTGADNLNVRAEPNPDAELVARIPNSTVVTVTGGPEKTDDLTWWQVETEDGTSGWAVEGVMDGVFATQLLLPLCPYTTNRIAYVHNTYTWDSPEEKEAGYRPYSTGNLYTVDPDGKNRCNLTGDAKGDVSELIWSPDGSKIAFGGVCVIHPDGTGQKCFGGGSSMSWSPDSTQIAYTMRTDVDNYGTAIWIVNVNTGRKYQVIASPDMINYVRWSPDGKLLAYVENHIDLYAENGAVRIIEPVNGTARTVTTPPKTDSPTGLYFTVEWSPDSTRLITVNGTLHDGFRIDVINIEDGSTTVIEEVGEDEFYSRGVEAPSYMPDGERILYWDDVGFGDGGGSLVLVDGDEKIELIDNVYQPNRIWNAVGFRTEGYMFPTRTSPDGSAVVYGSVDGVVVLDIESGETVIVDNSTHYTPPDWQPSGN